jgi:hypothetical protein
MEFDVYRLPDGTLVKTDATATKGRKVSDFTLVGGKVVSMYLVQAAPLPTWQLSGRQFCHECGDTVRLPFERVDGTPRWCADCLTRVPGRERQAVLREWMEDQGRA